MSSTRWLIDQHGLESTFEGGVLFDVLAVLVEGRGGNAVQFAAARQHRFEKVAGVHRAFRLAGADDGVQLVDEQDDLPGGGEHFLEHALESFLELAAEIGPGDEGAHVQGDDLPCFFKPFRHVAACDAGLEPSPSTMAVLPTPGSPISTGLFLVRRDSTWMTRRISSSRPMTGSSLSSRAIWVRSRPNCSRALYVASGSCELTLSPLRTSFMALCTLSRVSPTWRRSRPVAPSSSQSPSSTCSGAINWSFAFLASSSARVRTRLARLLRYTLSDSSAVPDTFGNRSSSWSMRRFRSGQDRRRRALQQVLAVQAGHPVRAGWPAKCSTSTCCCPWARASFWAAARLSAVPGVRMSDARSPCKPSI